MKDIDENGVEKLVFGANTDGWYEGSWDGIIYYTYNGSELNLVESALYYSPQEEVDPWFYSTENEPNMNHAKPISFDEATKIMSKYVHEHPQYTPFVK